MAINNVTITTQDIIEPIEGIGTVPQAGTLIPQHALIVYGNQLIPATGAGDNLRVDLYYSLPKNYAYKLTDFALGLGCDTTADLAGFSSVLTLNVNHNAQAADLEVAQHVPLNSWGTANPLAPGTADAVQRTWVPERMPSYPFDSVGTYNLSCYAYNSVVAVGEVVVWLYVRLLAYDKQQYSQWPLHTPQFSVR